MTENEKKILEQAEAIKKKEATKVKKRKGRFMKATIVCLFLFLLIFTCTVLYIFYRTGSEPSTLIASVFALCVGEFSILGLIKNKKGGGSNGA